MEPASELPAWIQQSLAVGRMVTGPGLLEIFDGGQGRRLDSVLSQVQHINSAILLPLGEVNSKQPPRFWEKWETSRKISCWKLPGSQVCRQGTFSSPKT